MLRKDGCTTNRGLLEQVVDWGNQPAWAEFFRSYDPLIHRWCGRYGLDSSTLEDLCQQIWIELATRMRTYRYDPGRTFRGWLRRFCQSRAIDLLRRRRAETVEWLDDQPAGARAVLEVDGDGAGVEGEVSGPRRALLLRQGERVQDAVKRRTEPRTWYIFWQVAVEGRSIREVAEAMGVTYAAVFMAHKRVVHRLRAEGARTSPERSSPC